MKTLPALLGALLLPASAAAAGQGSVREVDAAAIRAAAARCGLPPRFLEMGRDARGDRATISPHGDLDRFPYRSFECLLRWAQESGARVGFIAEPPPEPEAADAAATLPAEAWRAVALALLAPQTIINPTEVSVEAARAGVRARPRDADAWHQLGESLEVAGDVAAAAEAYRRATRLPPRVLGRAYLHRDLAAALERQGDLAGALAAARVSVRSWPLSQDGLYCASSEAALLARLLVKAGDMAGAAAFWRPLYDAQPEREECRRVQQALTGAAGA